MDSKSQFVSWPVVDDGYSGPWAVRVGGQATAAADNIHANGVILLIRLWTVLLDSPKMQIHVVVPRTLVSRVY